MDLQAQKRRFVVMLVADTVCVLIAAAAAYGAFVLGHDWLMWVFVAALVAGFAAQIWFIAGFKRANKGV